MKSKPKYAAKGLPKVPGKPKGTDIIPAWLTPGEAVLSPGAAEMLGRGNVQALNRAANHMRLGSPQYKAEGEDNMQMPDSAILGNQRADEILSNPDMFNAKEFRAAERYMDPAGLAGGPSPQRDAAFLVGTRSLDSINNPVDDATRQQFTQAQAGLFGSNRLPQKSISEDLTSEGLDAAQNAVSSAVSYGQQAAQDANDRARYMSQGGMVEPQYFMGGTEMVKPMYLALGMDELEKRKPYADMPTVTETQPQNLPAGYQAGQQLRQTMGGQSDRLGKFTAPIETGMNSLAEVYKRTGSALAAGTQGMANAIDQAQNLGTNFVRGGLGMKPNQTAPSLIDSANASAAPNMGNAMSQGLMKPASAGIAAGMNPPKPAVNPVRLGDRIFTDQTSADAAAKQLYYQGGMTNEGNRSYLTPSQAQTDFVNSGRPASSMSREELTKIYPSLRDAAAKNQFEANQRAVYQKQGLAVPWDMQTPEQRVQTQGREAAMAQRQTQNTNAIGNQMAGLSINAQRMAQGYMNNALTVLNNPGGYTSSQVKAAQEMLTRLTPLAQQGVGNSYQYYGIDANRDLSAAQANQANSQARLNYSTANLNEEKARQPAEMRLGSRPWQQSEPESGKYYQLDPEKIMVAPGTNQMYRFDDKGQPVAFNLPQPMPQQALKPTPEEQSRFMEMMQNNPGANPQKAWEWIFSKRQRESAMQ